MYLLVLKNPPLWDSKPCNDLVVILNPGAAQGARDIGLPRRARSSVTATKPLSRCCPITSYFSIARAALKEEK